ncbi:outer membrane immunogenic protein [Bradyrhizobium sp. i1.4.4]
MKKIWLALTAVAAMTGSASAADLAARPYVKAPLPAPVANWTGFYIFGGGGGGLSNSDQSVQTTVGAVPLTIGQRQGGSGWFGTVGLGYDWQFNSTWVAGVFADGQFGSIRGTVQDPFFGITGSQKLEDSWAAGVRLGYLVAPNVLSYVNGGYSGAHFGQTNFLTLAGVPAGAHLNSYNRNGWFVGGGVENSLNIFGISSPRLVHEDRISFGLLQRQDPGRTDRRHQPPDRQQHPRQQLEPDDLDLAGLPLQLDRSGRREVLI